MEQEEHLETQSFIVREEEAGQRIDRLLKERFVEKSRTYFQYLIEQECVLINGSAVKKRILLKEGDEVEVFFRLTPEISLEPQNIPLNILFEDEYIIAINKPPGMVVHPAPGHYENTFVNALLYHCKNIAPVEGDLRPGIVHRLDKNTSGVLIAAKTEDAHRKLIQAFSQRQMKKEYLAICYGKPENQTIEKPIGRHPTKRKEMCVSDKGKSALSTLHLLAYNEKKSLVLVQPETGRTHQIRVHLQSVQCPIVGDPVYGPDTKAKRHYLHAYRLSFLHPVTHSPLVIVAPIPEEMKQMIQKEFCQNSKNLVDSFS